MSEPDCSQQAYAEAQYDHEYRALAADRDRLAKELAEALRVLDTIDDEGDDHYYGIADRARIILRGIVTHGDYFGAAVNRAPDNEGDRETAP